MILAPWLTPLSSCGEGKLLSYRRGRAQTRGTSRNRKCHLDVGQHISVCPVPAQALHVLLPR